MTPLIVIGASAGGVDALTTLVTQLPTELAAPVLIVLHIGSYPSILPDLLNRRGQLTAAHARHGERLQSGRIYVAPPDHHLLVEPGSIVLTRTAKEHHARPAVDPLFRSAAVHYGAAAIGVILSGRLDDGAAGLHAIKQGGGVAIVQAPEEAEQPDMPRAALQAVDVDHCVKLRQMGPLLGRLVAEQQTIMATSPPDPSVFHEHAAGLGIGNAIEHLQAIGELSMFTCPDCHGTLWRLTTGGPERYRCHTGHAFTAGTLASVLAESRESALWSALRATEEQLLLVNRSDAVRPGSAAEGQASSLKAQIQTLRRLIEVQDDPLAETDSGQSGQ